VIVTDASVLTDALIDDGLAGQACRAALGADPHWAAPEYLLVEVFSAVRGRYLGGRLGVERARAAVTALTEVVVDTVTTPAVLARMWALRDRFSGYDAAYVATAEMFECPLVTADARLARSATALCTVVLVSAGGSPDDGD
jgi:predicted nucleic acid-binding protein